MPDIKILIIQLDMGTQLVPERWPGECKLRIPSHGMTFNVTDKNDNLLASYPTHSVKAARYVEFDPEEMKKAIEAQPTMEPANDPTVQAVHPGSGPEGQQAGDSGGSSG